jgi:L-rhamnose-H+ transport protein
MLTGILFALLAGTMLGLYALPEKFTRQFEFEHTWGLMFLLALFVVPLAAGLLLVRDFAAILTAVPAAVYWKMGLASLLWGVGVMMWSRAIDYIGLSLGFSLFIGTVILVGSLLPFIEDGLPAGNKLFAILAGILVVLVGVLLNGRAGMLRGVDARRRGGSMTTGVSIAVIGGLLATGFSYANAVGAVTINTAVIAAGNEAWKTAIVIMFVIYVAGGAFVVPYFLYQLTVKGLWGRFRRAPLGYNLGLTATMAILNFSASAAFAYAAFRLGDAGNTVGYAIFNTVSVCVAGLSGYLAGEWMGAGIRAKRLFFGGLAAMITGVLILAYGGSL